MHLGLGFQILQVSTAGRLLPIYCKADLAGSIVVHIVRMFLLAYRVMQVFMYGLIYIFKYLL